MGATIADVNKKIYQTYLSEGLTHEQIVKKIPRKFRKQFLIDIEKTAIQAHFGIADKYLFMAIAAVCVAALILGLTLA